MDIDDNAAASKRSFSTGEAPVDHTRGPNGSNLRQSVSSAPESLLNEDIQQISASPDFKLPLGDRSAQDERDLEKLCTEIYEKAAQENISDACKPRSRICCCSHWKSSENMPVQDDASMSVKDSV